MNDRERLDFCLLIPCYNNNGGLIRSLASVNYEGDKFLIVVVDDGSGIPVLKDDMEKGVGKNIPLVILRHEKNMGITQALNTGLAWIDKQAKTKYIARLDCGDICDPKRFYEQVAAMNAHPEAGLSASWCIFEDQDKKNRYEYKTPLTHPEIARAMYYRNVFIHPTIIFRASILREVGYYPKEFDPAEDYAFCWATMSVSQTFVIGKFLVTCEINKNGISYQNRGKQLAARQRVIQKFGTDQFLKITSILKLWMLFLVPKRLLLLLKSVKG